MVKIPPAINKCVGFVGSKRADGTIVLRGTVFFISRPVQGVANRFVCFAVTAKHVLDGIRRANQELCLRINMGLVAPDGRPFTPAVWVTFGLDEWVRHPDPTVDAAIMPMNTVHIFDMVPINSATALTERIISEEGIGVGDEVFMSGLFVNRPGTEKNIPIVRVGNIAAMADEKVYSHAFGDMDAFLVEARSIGGLSGSPAFVHLGVVRIKEGKGLVWANDPGGVFYWMGLVHGHYDGGLTEADEATGDAPSQRERVNMGIAIIVPAARVMEIFEEPKLKKLEADISAAGIAQLGPNPATPS